MSEENLDMLEMPKNVKEWNQHSYREISDSFTKFIWPITCCIIVAYNAIICIQVIYTTYTAKYDWADQYFAGAGLIISLFVVSYSHKHFIIRE